jgi:hypothetical protein
VNVELDDPVLRERIFSDFKEFLMRSGEAASIAKKQTRIMQIASSVVQLSSPSTSFFLPPSSSSSSSTSTSTSSSKRFPTSSLSKRELADQRKSLLMNLFKNTGIAKLPAIERHLTKLLRDPTAPKFLVFAHHHAMLDGLAKGVLKGVKTVRIDGRTSPKERQARYVTSTLLSYALPRQPHRIN